MQAVETKQIVDFIAATDGRNVTEQTYGAWHIVLGNLSFEQAREAAVIALQDEAIRWVEPKHILGKVSKMISDSEAEQRRERALTFEDKDRGTPMPKCRHDLGILYCAECCHQAAIDAGLIENKPFKKKR
jgi:hypothetical protein